MATVQLLVLISVGSCRYFLPATRAEGGTGWVLFPVLAHPACTHQEPHPPHTQRKHCSGYTVLYDGCFRVAFYVAVCLGSKKAARIRLAERSLQKVPVFTWQDTHHSDGGGAEGFEDLGGFGSASDQQRSGLLWIMNFHFSLKPEYNLKFLFIITMSEMVLKQHLWYEITGLKSVAKPIKTGNYHKIRRTQWLPITFTGPHITSRLKSYLINTLFDF